MMSAASLAKTLYGIGVVALSGAAWIIQGPAAALVVLGVGCVLAACVAFNVWLDDNLLK